MRTLFQSLAARGLRAAAAAALVLFALDGTAAAQAVGPPSSEGRSDAAPELPEVALSPERGPLAGGPAEAGARSSKTPRFALDARGGGHLTWREFRPEGWKCFYQRSLDGPLGAWSTPLDLGAEGDVFAVEIAAHGGASSPVVHVAWLEQFEGLERVVRAVSRDGGASWSAPEPVQGAPDASNVGNLRLIATPEGRVLLGWRQQESRYLPSKHLIHQDNAYASVSSDLGLSFSAPTQLLPPGDLNGAQVTDFEACVTAEGRLYVSLAATYAQGALVPRGLVVARGAIVGAGLTGLASTPLADPPGTPPGRVRGTSIGARSFANGSPDEVTVAYTHGSLIFGLPGKRAEVFASRSTDGGSSWTPGELLSSFSAGNSAVRPRLLMRGEDRFVFFIEETFFPGVDSAQNARSASLYCARSLAGSGSFESPSLVAADVIRGSNVPQFAVAEAASGRLGAAWIAHADMTENGDALDANIFQWRWPEVRLALSEDHGGSWQAVSEPLSTAAQFGGARNLVGALQRPAVGASRWFLVWDDRRHTDDNAAAPAPLGPAGAPEPYLRRLDF